MLSWTRKLISATSVNNACYRHLHTNRCLHSTKTASASAVTADKNETESSKLLENLLQNELNQPKENVTLFVRHSGDIFEYNKVLRSTHPTHDQLERIHSEQIKKSVIGASSVEDFLFVKPSAIKPFPKLSQLPSIYANLSKSRLTMLVVLTAMGGYAMAPGPFDPLVFSLLTLGTGLQSAAANTTNQIVEIKYDAQMYRTRNRVLVRGLISPQHAALFAATSGVVGTSLLYFGINPLTCYLGALNYFLYTCVYTPMKRMSVYNTWVGSVVGALPPLMGWAAATGSIDAGGLWIGLLLYIWQFPHFKALSWNIKSDYQRAGYLMSSVYNPDMCKRVAFRHTILMTLACLMGPTLDVTTNLFILYSVPFNLYGVLLGWRFYQSGDSSSSRKLFRYSLLQIPYLIVMMLVTKKWHKNSNQEKAQLPTQPAVSL